MKYNGPLYGKIRRSYIPLVQTSQEVDQMEKDLAEVKAMLERAMLWVYSSPVENGNRAVMIQRWEDFNKSPK